MKKNVFSVLFAAVLISTMTTSAFAGNHHGGRSAAELCSLEDCVYLSSHTHDNVNYSGHVAFCTFADCTEDGSHVHNGTTYGKHIGNCAETDCTLVGTHTHDDEVYCGVRRSTRSVSRRGGCCRG